MCTTTTKLLPFTVLVLLFAVSAAQNMTTSLLTLLFSKSLEPQQTAYFWLFMSWIYWFSPVSGWVSDICGSRKVLLLVGLALNIGTWCLIAFQAEGFTSFVVFGALQNASMLFVNSAINGALVEVASKNERENDDDNNDDNNNNNNNHNADVASSSPLSDALLPVPNADAAINDDDEAENNNSERNSTNSNTAVTNEEGSNSETSTTTTTTTLSKSGATQSTAMLARSLGSVVGAVVQTFLLIKLDIRASLGISIAVYGVAAICAVFADMTDEQNRNGSKHHSNGTARPNTESLCTRVQSLFIRLRQLCDANDTQSGRSTRSAATDVVVLLVFIFCVNMLPDATTFYQSYIFDAFEYPNWFNSCFQLINLVGALAACEVYRRWLAPLSQTRVFVAGCLCAAFSYVTGIGFCTGFTRDSLHISNSVYLLVDAFVVGFLNRIAFLPVLHVAASRCPKGFEAVVFELFSLAAMGGATVSYLIAIRIADAMEISRKNFTHLWILMVISAASRLLPLFVVPHLPPPNKAIFQREEVDAAEEREQRE